MHCSDIISCVVVQKRSISACSSYSSDDDAAEVVSAETRDDVTSGADEPLMSAEDVISEIESMMEVCICDVMYYMSPSRVLDQELISYHYSS